MTKYKIEQMVKKCLEILGRKRAYLRHVYMVTGFTSFITFWTTYRAYAEGTEGLVEVTSNLKNIFDPIIELLASLGYPATYGMIIVGGLMVITGRKAKGIEFIKWACVGYIIVQFIPVILNILDMVGRQLRLSV